MGRTLLPLLHTAALQVLHIAALDGFLQLPKREALVLLLEALADVVGGTQVLCLPGHHQAQSAARGGTENRSHAAEMDSGSSAQAVSITTGYVCHKDKRAAGLVNKLKRLHY